MKNLAIALITLSLFACASPREVQRIDASSTTDLSGQWNDTDSRLVSQEMIDDVLARPWINEFTRTKSRKPAVILGTIRNKSHEHINVATFSADMERALINSGRVDFVASKDERSEIREERKDQELNATQYTRNEMGNEMGADFMLKGDINSIYDTTQGKQVRFYQIDLTLISLANNRKVWLGQKKIKKLVSNDSIRP
jgi:uncharacterized protein (TIGR02722 family)